MTRTTPALVRVLDDGRATSRSDVVVTEEPLEIRLFAGSPPGQARTIGITMRTPGADFELAAGFLHTEGVVATRRDIRRIDYCHDVAPTEQRYNVVTVHLAADVLPELSSLERYGTITSACGVCGKASVDSLERRGVVALDPSAGPRVAAATLYGLPDALRAAQSTFAVTGGLHAAGLFTVDGDLFCAREDVGRHNAVDKAVGWALLKDRQADLASAVLVVSGRAGFEIVQKAAAAGIPVVCAVSAPSSLAVQTATRFGITLVGFLRGRRANVYAAGDRVVS